MAARRRSSRESPARADTHAWAQWLDQYPPSTAKEVDLQGAELQAQQKRVAARRLPIDDELDLHGCTIEEALRKTQRFIEGSKACGFRKVLIIHGKGNHNQGESLLRAPVRGLLATHPEIGETGTPGRDHGGDGAVWAVLRYRSR